MAMMTVDRHIASRLGPGPGSTFLLLTKIRLFLQFLSVGIQIKKIHYIEKVTIPHMANTHVCRYSQCITPKTPTTQTTVKLPIGLYRDVWIAAIA